MRESRTTTGILIVVLLAVIGYLLVTLPGKLLEGFARAKEVAPWASYVYLAVVGAGR